MAALTRRPTLAGHGPVTLLARAARAQAPGEAFRIGLVLPMTGPYASAGRQIDTTVRARLRANPGPLAGRRL